MQKKRNDNSNSSRDFFRFPSTPHLVWLGSDSPREDKVLTKDEANNLLLHPVTVEEKIDGANLGFSLGPNKSLRIQNRGQYLHEPYSGQFARLSEWLALHGDSIHSALIEYSENELILFGEWCAARHSLDYSALPDWFLLFDVYDKSSGKFFSSIRRNKIASKCSIKTVPIISNDKFNLLDLLEIINYTKSRFRSGNLEGVIVRQENYNWCEARAKIVRPDFTQTIDEHWSRRKIEWNKVDWSKNI